MFLNGMTLAMAFNGKPFVWFAAALLVISKNLVLCQSLNLYISAG